MQVIAQNLNNPAVQTNPEPQNNFEIIGLTETEVLETVIDSLNFFSLGFTIVFTIPLLVDFFQNRIFFGGGELAAEKQGVRALTIAMYIWRTYFVVLFFYLIFSTFRFSSVGILFGIVVTLLVIAKLWIDLIWILDTLSYFDFVSSFASRLQNILKIKK